MNNFSKISLTVILLALVIWIAGCGGGDDTTSVTLDIENLSQLQPNASYAAWVDSGGTLFLLNRFNTDSTGSARFTNFAFASTLNNGDTVFITIQPDPDPNRGAPTNVRVLEGTVSGNAAVLTFPRMQDFQNSTGFARVVSNNQLFTEFTNLPDVSDLGMIYQGFLESNGSFFPLKKFNSNQVPVSDTTTINPTTATYILSVVPVTGFDTSRPYGIQPFFTNGNLQPLIRQPLVRSSFTPSDANFRFPSAVATIR